MTSLLQAPTLDYCQKHNNLRGRRLSQTPSVDYGYAINQLRGRRFSLNPPFAPQDLFQSKSEDKDGKRREYEDTAVDDSELPALDKDSAAPALPSPLSDAHVSRYSTNVHIPRHHVAVGSSSNTILDASPVENNHKNATVIEVGEDTSCSKVLCENPRRRLISAFFAYFLCGWGDGVTGTVLPYLMAEFHLTDMTSSLLFTGTTVGFFMGTLLVERVSHVLGFFDLNATRPSIVPAFPFLYRLPLFKRSRAVLLGFSATQSRYVTMLVACVVHSMFFVLMGIKKGFPAMFMAYVIASFARALLTANLNLYLSTQGPKSALGYAFGFWSLGGVCAPIVCQSIIAAGAPWPHFYFGSLVVSGVNFCLVAYAYRPTLKEFYADRKEALRVRSQRSVSDSVDKNLRVEGSFEMGYADGESSPSSSASTIEVPETKNTLLRALRMPYQWAFAAFAWLYCGCETAFQGFIISYLLVARHANPKTVGYVTAGFWGGETVGRFLWGYFAARLGFTQRKYIMMGCLGLALVMHILIWFVNSNIENAFSTCIIGVMYGPIWPASLTMTSEVLPKDVQMVSMALLSALGGIGTALFPFITGAIANSKGVEHLPYLTVPQVATLLTVLTLLPSKIPLQVTGH